MTVRALSPVDRLLSELQQAMQAAAAQPPARRPSPGAAVPEADLDASERRHAGGLMRVNHTGEVCAQALYRGQAALARDAEIRAHLVKAAAAETDHLAWCAERLQQLHSRPSLLNPLWYLGSFAIGAAAAAVSDRVSLGFVVETERQVEAHLRRHQQKLPPSDGRSRAVLRQMQDDEIAHAQQAQALGGVELPAPLPTLMSLTSKLMKAVAYRI